MRRLLIAVAVLFPELVAYAKANPGKLSNPSSGNGTLSHLAKTPGRSAGDGAEPDHAIARHRRKIRGDGRHPARAWPGRIGAFLKTEDARWAAVVKASGVTIE